MVAIARGSVIRRVWGDGKRVSYAIKYRLPDGKQKFETIGPNKKEAERALAQRLGELDQGSYRELGNTTFDEFAQKWLSEYAEPKLKPSSLLNYQTIIRCHLSPVLGRYALKRITPAVLQDLVQQLRGKGLKPKSVNNAMVPLKRMMRIAVQWGFLAASPATALEPIRVPQIETGVLEPSELDRMIESADGEWRLFFMTAAYTGLRLGELTALQWQDIDWKSGHICVRRSVWRGHFDAPKSKNSIRNIDLMPSLVSALLEARPSGAPADYAAALVFARPDGRPQEPKLVRARFLKALARAGLSPVRFHDLRHSYASLLILADEHPKYIQAQLGHASIQMTMDRYGHLLRGVYGHRGENLERRLREAQREAREGEHPADSTGAA